MASDCDDNDQRIDIVGAHAPRPNLGDQYPRVYRVAVRAIKEVEMHIGTVNAFPEGEADGREYLRKILIKHATTLKYKDMTKRLRDDKNKKYWRKFASIVRAQAIFDLLCSLIFYRRRSVFPSFEARSRNYARGLCA